MNWLELIKSTTPVGAGVLGILLLFSLISWAIMLYKHRVLRLAQKRSLEFVDLFWKIREFDQIFDASHRFETTSVAKVFRQGYQALKQNKSPAGIEQVEHALRRACMSEVTELERLIPFLATVGSTATFIGLFGTVIGIINAFHEIGAKGSASLVTVAPGIAEALIATAAGLVVAIPAVIAYNYFATRVRSIGAEIETFAGDFLNVVKRQS